MTKLTNITRKQEDKYESDNITQQGYYWVKFYNYKHPKICYWNGNRFESFKRDFPDDEIELVNKSRIEYHEGIH